MRNGAAAGLILAQVRVAGRSFGERPWRPLAHFGARVKASKQYPRSRARRHPHLIRRMSAVGHGALTNEADALIVTEAYFPARLTI